MADITTMIIESIMTNWMLFLMIIFGVLAIVPWIGLAIVNFFNHNVVEEILATWNRKKVKVIKVFQNGQIESIYREMQADRSILMDHNKNTGIDEVINPSTPPLPDRKSHRQVYLTVEGQEGTKNPLEDSKYDVNPPQKKMPYTMAFELGREFERAFMAGVGQFDFMPWIQTGIPTLLLFVVLFMVYTNGSMLGDIMKAMGLVS